MIREARSEDEVRLRAIQTNALDEPWPELLGVGIDGPPLVLVLDIGEPLGYALVVPDHPVAYLAEFAIAPGKQGQGLGTTLMNGLLDRLRTSGFETVRLTARADDNRARSFYDGFGFSVADELPDHYDDGDGVLFVRDL
ncbi:MULTISPECIES: N-acetyltransferase [Haloarcula]|jgi:ribosomal-protein-alanine N-acetyltransferase|uniref:N-acetyltransferase n=1 Tax=Haloarcula marismortui (strain ATCC 43049 / DSM 3752 / JCM 8966 / VKM B-1809) TaxID=272569 RepID=Q5V1H8_HALMA|nr:MULTISPECIES: GNAT family N-acetyltransferase [Haloarcula]AAV46624.1 Pab N-terminal acetyltransferase [Haloarcula marismortui ATCC 43049]NHN65567.1 GNAT family N-acetyltransferase [Haloarcula sp. JP-Z28]NHX40660.1 GNAT family N-acetyltransferase [Haloarcula sp. R1-2]QCP91337.1 N-acetyltransferase [Haloarcula marismortui ATCC 43049]